MLSPRASTKLCGPKQAAQLARAVALSRTQAAPLGYCSLGLRASQLQQQASGPRRFSTTPALHLRDFFPAKETEQIRKTAPAWPHEGYSMEDMLSVVPGHRKPETWGDWVAWKLVRVARYCMDRATGLKPEQQVDKKNPTTAVVASQPLTEAQWVSVLLYLHPSRSVIA